MRFREVCVLTGDPGVPDATKPGSQFSDLDLRYHAVMREALESLAGYHFEFLSDHSKVLARMLDDPPEFVLNFCDTGFHNVATQELHVPALLELLGIPYSGAPPACMTICYDKAVVRLIAESLGVATPWERYIEGGRGLDALESLEYPALVKPNQADGSVGITRDAVVHSAAEARACVAELRSRLPERTALLVQEYLPDTEYGLALIGNPGSGFTVLPPLRVDYSALPSGLAPILAYESKTEPTSPYWTAVHVEPAVLEDADLARLVHAAERLFERLQCRDYARFDFRTGADGTVKLLEVNPNPAWDFEAKLARMAGFAGKSYAELLEMLLETAQVRLAASARP